MIKLTTVRHQGVCEIGCRRYLARPDYGCHMREFQAAGVQLPPKIKCTRQDDMRLVVELAL